MSLDLTMFGDPSGIRSVGDWLHAPLDAAALEVDIDLMILAGDAVTLWSGESGYAFNSAAQAARRATSCVMTFAENLSEVMRAFASRLERGEAFFEEVKQHARDGDLRVRGKVVYAPTSSLMYCPGPEAPAEDLAAYDLYVVKLRLYNDLGSAVGQWEGETEVWVHVHFGALLGDLDDLVAASAVLEALRNGNKYLVDSVIATAAARTDLNLEHWRTEAGARASAYDDYKWNRRSGHPGRRAAAAKAIPQDLRRAIGDADKAVRGLARASRIIPGIGFAVDVGVGFYDIGQGASPSSVGAGVAGAGAGVVFGEVVAAAVGGPVTVVVGTVVVAAWAGGEGGTWLWESSVSLGTRESIDEGLRNLVGEIIFWDDSLRVPN